MAKSTKSDLLPVETALARLTGRLSPVGIEVVPLSAASGRVLAADLAARRTQPPAAMSAMDGYAVRAVDVARVPATLGRVGVSAAGRGFAGAVGPGQAVRIFTGAPIPDGAETVVIQEDTESDGDIVTVRGSAPVGRHIRAAGIDFVEGDVLLHAGRTLGPQDIALAAAMNHPWLSVHRAPRVAILATGDELVLPGEPVGPDQIICSNAFGIAAMVRAWGGEAIDLGIARDEREALRRAAAGAHGVDILVTIGGISVGDHDLVRGALGKDGLDIDFWRIAMRPGKPLMFGRLGQSWVLGLPGNPVSALVCALVFLRPAIDCLLGREDGNGGQGRAVLARALPENDGRQDYLRAELGHDRDGTLTATSFELQDSSVLSLLSRADCLVIRPPHSPAAPVGTTVPVLPLPGRMASRM